MKNNKEDLINLLQEQVEEFIDIYEKLLIIGWRLKLLIEDEKGYDSYSNCDEFKESFKDAGFQLIDSDLDDLIAYLFYEFDIKKVKEYSEQLKERNRRD